MKHQIFLGLGSNIGDRDVNLNQALELLQNEIGELVKVSSVFETKAWGITDQGDFLNIAAEFQTKLFPLQVLDIILDIETKMGRKRIQKWGARNIDIDILYFNNWYFHFPNLTVPHPYISERSFVLSPLSEIAGDFRHPIIKQKQNQLLEKLTQLQEL